MSAMGLIISLIIVALGVAWVMLPVIQQSRRKEMSTTRERDELLTQYERVLSAIRDLDEDFQTGKLDEATYSEERSLWAQRGVQILQRLEARGLRQPAGTQHPESGAVSGPEDELEAAIARYVQSKAASSF